jgi:hypothetical protein
VELISPPEARCLTFAGGGSSLSLLDIGGTMKSILILVIAVFLLPIAARAETVADAIKETEAKEANLDHDGAFQIYSAILQQYPKEFPEVWAARADVRNFAEDEKGAVADYTMALSLDKDPKNPVLSHGKLYHDRAMARRFSGDTKGAVADFH